MAAKDLELPGFWWDPASPEERWAGTLRINRKGRSTLTLTIPPPSFPFLTDSREYDVLHGETNVGHARLRVEVF